MSIRKIFNYLKKNFNCFKYKNLIKVYSHPRSGTHFLEAFLAENFFNKKKLLVKDVSWGHWSNRMKREGGNEFGKLFGSHEFPVRKTINSCYHKIYIYRDGRDVAYSIWKTPNFINPKYKEISFRRFLDIKIDWEGSPAHRVEPKENIVEHWERHVKEWKKISDKKLMIIKYEDLLNDPVNIYCSILKKYFPIKFFMYKFKIYKHKVVVINHPVGLKPNDPGAGGWKKNFSKTEKSIFLRYIKDRDMLHG